MGGGTVYKFLTYHLVWVPIPIHDVRYTQYFNSQLLGPLVVTSYTKTLNCDMSSLENYIEVVYVTF